MASKALGLPAGGMLSQEHFDRRHRTLRVLLAVHVPILAVLAYEHSGVSAELLLAPLVGLAALLAGGGDRRGKSLIVAVGLALCSASVIGLDNGSAQSHYHVLVMLGFVALYQDWPPLLSFLALTITGYVVAAALEPSVIFGSDALGRPLLAAVHVAFIVAEAVALVVFWRATELEQERATGLATTLARNELERTRDQDAQNRASTELLTSLARRNQLLLDRQLQRIDDLEQTERDPEALAELFGLDHLATRMRRNAESLLVLAGGETSRTWEQPVPLSEICRGAMAEVEDYARVDVALLVDVLVLGPVVSDLVHLIAELIENATAFSPPTSRVMVSGNLTSSRGYVLVVSDEGFGMADAELTVANATLGDADGAGVGTSGMLGLRVVARLAARYGIRVWLQRGQGSQAGGLAAMLALPVGALDPQSVQPAAPLPQPIFVPAQVTAPVVQAAESTAPTQFAPLTAPTEFAALTAAGLTRRVPRASLAAPLALGPDAVADVRGEPGLSTVAPERARTVLAAFTDGVQRAREQTPLGAQPTQDQDSGDGA